MCCAGAVALRPRSSKRSSLLLGGTMRLPWAPLLPLLWAVLSVEVASGESQQKAYQY